MTAFGDFLKKATGVFGNFTGLGGTSLLMGKDGDVIYSKNNVCVHSPAKNDEDNEQDFHSAGYLAIHCHQDDQIGMTLILQWLPNLNLERNPSKIRQVISSPQRIEDQNRIKLRHLQTESVANAVLHLLPYLKLQNRVDASSSDSDSYCPGTTTTTTPVSDRNNEAEHKLGGICQVIDDTEGTDPTDMSVYLTNDQLNVPALATSGQDEWGSPPTSEADKDAESDEDGEMSSYNDSEEEEHFEETTSSEWSLCPFLTSTPEQFALSRNLLFPDDFRTVDGDQSSIEFVDNSVHFHHRSPTVSLFSVNLDKMRSLRLFYSDRNHNSGQLVIASPESQYKILHFHHGGLDKLAQILDQWHAFRAANDPPNSTVDRHFWICQSEMDKHEVDPEDGLYDKVDWEFWKSSSNKDGVIDDELAIRTVTLMMMANGHVISPLKAIFYASMDDRLRRQVWPFLLKVYPWNSDRDHRESLRNDLFIQYQNIRKLRMRKNLKFSGKRWQSVEDMILRDVVITDRRNPTYQGHVDMLRSILVNYAVWCPSVGYIQGMCDLLEPILDTARDETEAFWCFVGLMRTTMFASCREYRSHVFDRNLTYLRELLSLFTPAFHQYLSRLGTDALQLIFAHRWLLLLFGREFTAPLSLWEACWSCPRTSHFPLFICVAIVSVYCSDAVLQNLNHDELLFFVASLAMHMDMDVILKKARGLLYQFCRLEKISCTLVGLCQFESDAGRHHWDSHLSPVVECHHLCGSNDDDL